MVRGTSIVVALAALAACTHALGGTGETCVLNSDCAALLVCAASSCRPQCRADRDCGTGETCHTVGTVGVCVPPGADVPCAAASDCDATETCRSSTCHRTCTTDAECEGTTCAMGACTRAASAALPVRCASDRDCTSAERCFVDPTRGSLAVPVCRPRCASDTECPNGTRCVHARPGDDGGFEDVCSVPCDPALDRGCPAGATCSLDVVGSPSGEVVIPLCRAPSAGAEGCSCAHGLSTDCAAAMSCRTDVGYVCARMCTLGTSCADGSACQRGNPTWLASGRDYGFCRTTGCP